MTRKFDNCLLMDILKKVGETDAEQKSKGLLQKREILYEIDFSQKLYLPIKAKDLQTEDSPSLK